jgi:hypothetical protein
MIVFVWSAFSVMLLIFFWLSVKTYCWSKWQELAKSLREIEIGKEYWIWSFQHMGSFCVAVHPTEAIWKSWAWQTSCSILSKGVAAVFCRAVITASATVWRKTLYLHLLGVLRSLGVPLYNTPITGFAGWRECER